MTSAALLVFDGCGTRVDFRKHVKIGLGQVLTILSYASDVVLQRPVDTIDVLIDGSYICSPQLVNLHLASSMVCLHSAGMFSHTKCLKALLCTWIIASTSIMLCPTLRAL